MFTEIFTHATKSAKDMDCIAIHQTGYVAISNTIESDKVDLSEGSPVIQIKNDDVNIVQYFSMKYQNKVYLRCVFDFCFDSNWCIGGFQFADAMATICTSCNYSSVNRTKRITVRYSSGMKIISI